MKRLWKILFTNPDHLTDEEVLESLLIYHRFLRTTLPIVLPFVPLARGICATLWYLLQGIVLLALGLRDVCAKARDLVDEVEAGQALIRRH